MLSVYLLRPLCRGVLSAESLPSEKAETFAGKSLICMELEPTLVAKSRQGVGKAPDKQLAYPAVCAGPEGRVRLGPQARLRLLDEADR